MRETLKEKWVKQRGWTKVKGYKIDLGEIQDVQDDWDYLYLTKSELRNYVEKVEYWMISVHTPYSYHFEDIDDVIKFIEERSGEKFDARV